MCCPWKCHPIVTCCGWLEGSSNRGQLSTTCTSSGSCPTSAAPAMTSDWASGGTGWLARPCKTRHHLQIHFLSIVLTFEGKGQSPDRVWSERSPPVRIPPEAGYRWSCCCSRKWLDTPLVDRCRHCRESRTLRGRSRQPSELMCKPNCKRSYSRQDLLKPSSL